jgi:predicted CoA-binding protein
VVGLSPKEHRPSNRVARYLIAAGFTVIPVNPGQERILGQTCYSNLAQVPVPVDLVDIFRASAHVLPIVEEAIAIGAKAVWMQKGIVNEEAATLARRHGLVVVMGRCLMVDHQAWQGINAKTG